MRMILRALSCALALCASAASLCQPLPGRTATPTLPPPSTDPLGVDLSPAPTLRLARVQPPSEQFRSLVQAAVEHHPGTLEAAAQTAEARAVVGEANERRLPSIDLSVSSSH